MAEKPSSLYDFLDSMSHPLLPGLGQDGVWPEHPFVYVGEAYFKGWYAGRADMAREILLLLGTDQFGPPDSQIKAKLDAISSELRLRDLAVRVRGVTGWEQLLTRR
jgi:hypothetical protein